MTACIQCSMKALVENKPMPVFDEAPEQHRQRLHSDLEQVQRERAELERRVREDPEIEERLTKLGKVVEGALK